MKIKVEKQENYFLLFHTFGVLWNIALIQSANNFIIAGATCIWYYNNQDDGKSPISRPIWWLFRYHLGTVSFGAFILAIVWALRIIFEYIEVKFSKNYFDFFFQEKTKSAQDNKMVKCVACCVRCVLHCAERFVKFFNKHAFAETVMKGTGFCTSAQEAMKVIICNAVRFGMMHGLGSLVMIFAKLFIMISVSGLSYLILVNFYDISSDMNGIRSLIGPISVKFSLIVRLCY